MDIFTMYTHFHVWWIYRCLWIQISLAYAFNTNLLTPIWDLITNHSLASFLALIKKLVDMLTKTLTKVNITMEQCTSSLIWCLSDAKFTRYHDHINNKTPFKRQKLTHELVHSLCEELCDKMNLSLRKCRFYMENLLFLNSKFILLHPLLRAYRGFMDFHFYSLVHWTLSISNVQ